MVTNTQHTVITVKRMRMTPRRTAADAAACANKSLILHQTLRVTSFVTELHQSRRQFSTVYHVHYDDTVDQTHVQQDPHI